MFIEKNGTRFFLILVSGIGRKAEIQASASAGNKGLIPFTVKGEDL
jgi:hypothetical protein